VPSVARSTARGSGDAVVAPPPGDVRMFLMIAGVLIVCWLLGFVVFHVSSFLIHVLLLLAVISLIWNFVSGRRGA
jgi:hypothetical protein